MSSYGRRLQRDAGGTVSASCIEAPERSETGRAMLNAAPIFVNAFARGGSMILVNLLLSHPNVCCPSGETQKVFQGDVRSESHWRSMYKRIRYGLPLAFCSGDIRFMSPWNFAPRRELPQWARRHIDWVLYREKLAARHEQHNRFVREGIAYTDDQIARARLMCKNLNGLILMTDNFAAMYPDATFFGLIRNGLALCEGYVRRGANAQYCAEMYRLLVGKMLKDASRLEGYHIVRFEDIVRDPFGVTEELYRHARLDFAEVEKVRMQIKPTTAERCLDHRIVWYPKADLLSYFRTDVDHIQATKLSASDRDTFLKIAGSTMEMAGYS
jgi:hypothetical protein